MFDTDEPFFAPPLVKLTGSKFSQLSAGEPPWWVLLSAAGSGWYDDSARSCACVGNAPPC